MNTINTHSPLPSVATIKEDLTNYKQSCALLIIGILLSGCGNQNDREESSQLLQHANLQEHLENGASVGIIGITNDGEQVLDCNSLECVEDNGTTIGHYLVEIHYTNNQHIDLSADFLSTLSQIDPNYNEVRSYNPETFELDPIPGKQKFPDGIRKAHYLLSDSQSPLDLYSLVSGTIAQNYLDETGTIEAWRLQGLTQALNTDYTGANNSRLSIGENIIYQAFQNPDGKGYDLENPGTPIISDGPSTQKIENAIGNLWFNESYPFLLRDVKYSTDSGMVSFTVFDGLLAHTKNPGDRETPDGYKFFKHESSGAVFHIGEHVEIPLSMLEYNDNGKYIISLRDLVTRDQYNNGKYWKIELDLSNYL